VDPVRQQPDAGVVHAVPGRRAYHRGFLSPWTVFYLEPSTTHTFRVTASDYFGNSVDSNVLSVTTPPKADNVAPTNLQFSFQTAHPSSG